MSDLALSIVLGVALAAATGFRVFLPMLIVSGAAYTGHLHLDDGFAWLGTPSALIMLSVAAARGSPGVLHSGRRQPARHFGDPRRLRRRDDRVGGRHDRCAANGEMDGGRDRRRRRRRTDPRVDRDSSGPLDRSDRRPWELRHRHRGTWRRRPDLLPRAWLRQPSQSRWSCCSCSWPYVSSAGDFGETNPRPA